MSYFSLNQARQRTFVAAFSLLLGVVAIVGCRKGADDGAQPDANAAAVDANAAPKAPEFSIEIRNLSAEKLAALGEKNDLPTENIFPNAYSVHIIRPERLRALEKGGAALDFFETSALQLPQVGLFDKANLVLSSKTFSLETLKDAKSNAVLEEKFPTPAEAVYIRSAEPFDQKAIGDAIFHRDGGPDAQITTQTFGGKELQIFESMFGVPLDQTGQNFGKIDKMLAGLYFPTPNSLVLLSGAPSAFESFFSDKPGDERGIVAQQAGRVDLETLDVAFLYDYDSEVSTTALVPLPFPATPELGEAIQKYAASFRFVADATTPDGALLTLTVDAKSADGANELKKTIGGALMQAVDGLAKMPQENDAQKEAAKSFEKMAALLKTTNLAVDGAKVVGTLKNTPEALDFIAGAFENLNEFRVSSEENAKYAAADQAVYQLGRALNAYLGKNKTFPAPICAPDGTPLLSWRVALLPLFGDEAKKLYDRFKLDEPWNSDNNIQLLDKIPSIYISPLDKNPGTKTSFLIVNSPNSPFGRSPQGLKIQDVANPARTTSVVLVDSQRAVEWTRPETLAFDPEKPAETFGPVFCGVTLTGEIVRFPVDDTPETAKQIASLIFGVDDAAPAENSQPEEPAASAPAENSQPEEPAASAPAENSQPEEPAASAPAENSQPEEAQPAPTPEN